MPSADDILANNLGDALGQAQKFVFSGIVSAALLVLLSFDSPELISLKQKIKVERFGEVAPGMAAIILWLTYLISGFLANAAITRITDITSRINSDEMTKAMLTRFSIVTLESATLRVSAALLAPVLLLISYTVEQARGAIPPTVIIAALGILAISAPYVVLAFRLVKPLKV